MIDQALHFHSTICIVDAVYGATHPEQRKMAMIASMTKV